MDQGDHDRFRSALNVHGFGFHYSVATAVQSFRPQFGSPFRFIGAEVPVALNGVEMHVDLVFWLPDQGTYLVAECKRADPALAEWCFSRSGFTVGGSETRPTLDALRFVDSNSLHLNPIQCGNAASLYQVGVAVKRQDRKGDGCGSDRDAIAKHSTQVLRASNGLMQLCQKNPKIVQAQLGPGGGPVIVFLPVLFTTARLVVSDDVLSLADLASGNLPASTRFSEVPWLWFQQAVSESLQAKVPGREVAETWSDWAGYFRRVSIRAVAIVNAESVATFLHQTASFLD